MLYPVGVSTNTWPCTIKVQVLVLYQRGHIITGMQFLHFDPGHSRAQYGEGQTRVTHAAGLASEPPTNNIQHFTSQSTAASTNLLNV